MARAPNSLRAHIEAFAASESARSLRQQFLIVAAAFLVATLMTMGGTLWSLKDSLRDSEAAENTMLEITTIELRLMEDQGAVNGFALTGDGWYQRKIGDDRRDLAVAMDRLKHSLQNNPAQSLRYAQIVPLVRSQDALIAYLRQPEHRVDADWRAKALSGQRLISVIRNRLWAILMEQRAKRYANHHKMIGEATSSFWLALGIVLISVLMALGFFGLRAKPDDEAVPQLH